MLASGVLEIDSLQRRVFIFDPVAAAAIGSTVLIGKTNIIIMLFQNEFLRVSKSRYLFVRGKNENDKIKEDKQSAECI